MAGKAEPRPPVEAAYLDVHASGALKDGGVPIGAVIDDADPSARAKDPDGLAEGPGAFGAAMDIAEGQVAEHHVERPGRKGKISCIGSYELDTFAGTSIGSAVASAASTTAPWQAGTQARRRKR